MAWSAFMPGGALYDKQMRQNAALAGGVNVLPPVLPVINSSGRMGQLTEEEKEGIDAMRSNKENVAQQEALSATNPQNIDSGLAQAGADKRAIVAENDPVAAAGQAVASEAEAKKNADAMKGIEGYEERKGEVAEPDYSWVAALGPSFQWAFDEYSRQQKELADQQAENERRQRGLRANQYVAGLGDILASIANLSYVGKGAKKGGLGARNQVQTYGLPLQTERILQDRRLRQQQEETMKNRLANTRLQVMRSLGEASKQEQLNERARLTGYNSAVRNEIAQGRLEHDREKFEWQKGPQHDLNVYKAETGRVNANKVRSSGSGSSGGTKTLTYAQRVDRMKANVSGLISAIQAKEGNGSAAGIADNELRRLVKEAREGKKSAVEALISIYGRQYADWWREYGVDEWAGSGGSSSSGGSSGGSSSGSASSGGGLGLGWGQSAENEETAGGLGLGWGKN